MGHLGDGFEVWANYRSRQDEAEPALERLLVVRHDDAYCQPCFPPVWDTAIAVLALHESGGATAAIRRALD